MGTLIAEDLLLLLLDDDSGTMAAASAERPLFGGAVLVELALAGLVEVEERRSVWHSAKVRPTGSATPPTDPLLSSALTTVREKPRSATELVQRLGKGVRDELLRRLEARGMVQRREEKVFGLFPYTRWPAADLAHERQVRVRLEGVLVHGLTPDPRTGALVALLHAVGQAHKVVRADLSDREVKKRAKAIAEGDWAAKAVQDAVAAAVSAAVTATVAASAAATSAGS